MTAVFVVIIEEDLDSEDAQALMEEFEESLGKKGFSLDEAEWDYQ